MRFFSSGCISFNSTSHLNQILYVIGQIIRVWGPCRVLGFHRVLGRPRVLGPRKVLDTHRVLGPGSFQGPGSRFSGMPTSSQIARLIIDLAVSLNINTNTTTISIIRQNDHMDNKSSQVNNRLVNMCGERHIPVIATICPGTYLNKGGLHLNEFGTTESAKNIFRYLSELN